MNRKNFAATGSFLAEDRGRAIDLLGFSSQLVFNTFHNRRRHLRMRMEGGPGRSREAAPVPPFVNTSTPDPSIVNIPERAQHRPATW